MDSQTKACSRCGRVKPLTEYYSHKGHSDGRQAGCKVCIKAYNMAYYYKDVRDNADAIEARRRRGREWYQANKEYARRRISENHRIERQKALDAYGGCCACCGESHYEFLAIDHINGGGYEHRKSAGNKFTRWLAQQGYPADLPLRVLCHNCNSALGYYGYCPHQTEPKTPLVRKRGQNWLTGETLAS